MWALKRKNKLVPLYVFILMNLLLVEVAVSSRSLSRENEVRYRTSFGNCPSRTAGSLTLNLVKEFEKRMSLRDVKQKIIDGKLSEKHFISKYEIKYDPLKRLLNFSFDCPLPLMKVQIYKGNGLQSYDAILVDNGKLYDPTYEILLRTERKLNHELPFLALPVGKMDNRIQQRVTKLIKNMDLQLRKKLAEVIVSDIKELTVILSIDGRPSSVFMGADNWGEKVKKLQKIVKYMKLKNRIPSIINITNTKKVVVKFNDKF